MTTDDSLGTRYEVRRQARGAEPPPSEHPWRRRFIIGGIAVVVVAALVAAVWGWYAFTHVTAVTAELSTFVTQCSPETDGHLGELYVTEGDRVSSGQALGRLKDAGAQAVLAAARAEYALRQSQVAQAAANAELVKARVKADQERAGAAVEIAEARVEDAQALLERRTVEVEEEVRRADALKKEAAARLARLKMGAREEDMEAAQARLAAARAQHALYQLEVRQSEELVGEGIDSEYILQVRKTRLETQRNAVLEAELELKRLKAGPTKEEIVAAEQALAARQADLALARAGRRQLAALEATLAIRRAELVQARASLEQARASRANVALAQEAVKAAKAQRDMAAESVKQRQADLDDTRIVTEIAGVVTRIYPEVGEFCRTGETAILVARQGGDFWVNAWVRERDAPLVGVGQPARIKVLAGSRDWVEAEVTQVSAHTQARDATPDATAPTGGRTQGQRVWVKLRPTEPLEEGLKHGMSARAVIRVR